MSKLYNPPCRRSSAGSFHVELRKRECKWHIIFRVSIIAWVMIFVFEI